MPIVIISPTYEITIPPDICNELDIQLGQTLQFIVESGRIVLVPTKTARELRGFLRGIDTTVEREDDRL